MIKMMMCLLDGFKINGNVCQQTNTIAKDLVFRLCSTQRERKKASKCKNYAMLIVIYIYIYIVIKKRPTMTVERE